MQLLHGQNVSQYAPPVMFTQLFRLDYSLLVLVTFHGVSLPGKILFQHFKAVVKCFNFLHIHRRDTAEIVDLS